MTGPRFVGRHGPVAPPPGRHAGDLDFGVEPYEEETVVLTFEQIAREKALELAEKQATDDEIEAALVRRCRQSPEAAAEIVKAMAEELQRARFDGRARLREHAYAVAQGLAGGDMSGIQASVLNQLGNQHLGWTREGMAEKVRKTVEKATAAAEKQAAKAKREGSG